LEAGEFPALKRMVSEHRDSKQGQMLNKPKDLTDIEVIVEPAIIVTTDHGALMTSHTDHRDQKRAI
jgi:hypothetical protein